MTLPMVKNSKIIDLQGFAYQVINSIFTQRDHYQCDTHNRAKKTVTSVSYSADVLKQSYTFRAFNLPTSF